MRISDSTPRAHRLLSLDVFRGLVILSMLLVNNLGDFDSTGYFWKHANWIEGTQAAAWSDWWAETGTADNPISFAFTQLPLWRHCTLADFVMPWFMLVIGVSMPFSIAGEKSRSVPSYRRWLHALKRAAMLVMLGWILCYFRDQFAAQFYKEKPFHLAFGMDVLQLLGVGYLVTRILIELPKWPRILAIGLLFVAHYAVLRFWPQGDVAAGTFTAKNNAISHIYNQPWWIWREWHVTSFLSINWKGLMSVPPAAATMLLGTFIGQWLRRDDVEPLIRVRRLFVWGIAGVICGFLWAFDLPFNKPRWSPSYLVYCSGVGTMVIAVLYLIIDVLQSRGWTYPLVVFGSNAIAAYWLSILAKVLLLNTPRVNESHPITMGFVKWGTFGWCAAIIFLVALRILMANRRRVDGIAWAVLLVPVAGSWIAFHRFWNTPIQSAGSDHLTPLTSAVASALKQPLGNWEGGWMFTICFVAFWWLILDLAYVRKIFWKL